jgi:hypothetical protein
MTDPVATNPELYSVAFENHRSGSCATTITPATKHSLTSTPTV